MTTPTPSDVQPLGAHPIGQAEELHGFEQAAAAGAAVGERDRRFADGLRTLRVGSASVVLEERLLMVLGGVVAPLGLIVILLGWWGAAHSPYVFDQLPYLISGGLLGLGLVFVGAFLYFAHWLTQLLKEQRVQSAAVLMALQRLQDQVGAGSEASSSARLANTNGSSHPKPRAGALDLVATERGTMAHRPACAVVAGKGGLRGVTPADGLSACKLCNPYAPERADP